MSSGLRGAPKSPSPMTMATRLEIVCHAVRWTQNMLVEVLGNHGHILTTDQRDTLKRAVVALGEFRT